MEGKAGGKMSKQKDYMRLFVEYCKKHGTWYEVQGKLLYSVTYWFDCEDDTYWPQRLKFGTKAAYDWLIKTHKEIVNE